MSSLTQLRPWLVQQTQNFIDAYFKADLSQWVLCVGNEAGDLDTLASSIAYAYLSSFVVGSAKNFIPIQLTPSSGFQLRPENLAALKDAIEVDDQSSDLQSDLIYSDTLDFSKFTPYGAKYALVDHNEIISSVFGSQADVIAVIDHHEPAANNTLYPLANPRIIQVPTGSCASLVTNYFAPSWKDQKIPIGLADLLLSAIVLDTSNLKPIAEDGKATAADFSAKDFLLPRSRYAGSTQSSATANISQSGTTLDEVYKRLSDLKSDVSRLNSTQLLQRDYKQYEVNGWKLGLSTVPIGLTDWLHDKEADDWNRLLTAVNEYGASKGLDAVGTLTSSKLSKASAKALNQPRKAKQLLLLLRQSTILSLYDGLDHPEASVNETLNLSPLKIDDPNVLEAFGSSNGVHVKVWSLGNTDASRKQVAPILTNLMTKLASKPISTPAEPA